MVKGLKVELVQLLCMEEAVELGTELVVEGPVVVTPRVAILVERALPDYA